MALWKDAREISRMREWKAPGPFMRWPPRDFARRGRDQEEMVVIEDDDVSSKGGRTASTTSTASIGSASGGSIRQQSSESSFWLSSIFSELEPSSSGSSAASSDDEDEDASSVFQRPPRPPPVRPLLEILDLKREAEAEEGEEEGQGEKRAGGLPGIELPPEEDPIMLELQRKKAELAQKTRTAYDQLRVTLQHWVARAAKRRRQVIGFHERRYRTEREEEKARLVAYYDRQQRAKDLASFTERKDRSARDILDRRRLQTEQRIERTLRRCDRRREGTRVLLDLVHEEAMDKAIRAREEAQGKLRAKRRAERMRLDYEQPDETPECLREIEETRQVLSLLRRSGQVGGVRKPEGWLQQQSGEEGAVRVEGGSTQVAVTLRLAGKLVRIHGKGKGKEDRLADVSRAFNVDLERSRNVTLIRGEALLDRGAALLGCALGLGLCSQLRTLQLNSNAVGRVGLEGLMRGLMQGGARQLESLSLQRNNLTGRSMDCIAAAAKRDALLSLKRLDLRYNEIQDRGAAALASALLSSKLVCLEHLLLQQNDIKDQGLRSLYMAALVDPSKFCPALQVLNVRQNSFTPACLRSLKPLAPALVY